MPAYTLHEATGDVYANGIFYPDSQTRIGQIIDGTSNTLAIGERVLDLWGWMSGAEAYRGSSPKIWGYSTKNVLFPINANSENFSQWPADFVPPRSCPANPGDCLAATNYLPFGSEHTGGANFAFADGSVHFLQESIDLILYYDLADKDGEHRH
jgi:prepilin-type processing-associated H-X9-DG protein